MMDVFVIGNDALASAIDLHTRYFARQGFAFDIGDDDFSTGLIESNP